MTKRKGKWLVISAVVFVSLVYWLPKIVHDIRVGW